MSMKSAGHVGFKFVSGTLGDDTAVVNDDDLIRQFIGFFQVLGGQQQGRPDGDEVADGIPHGDAPPRVQAGGRLIEEKNVGTRHDARRQIEPAAHTA